MPQVYENVYAFVNGQLLAENTTVEGALEADNQDVMTIVKNWAGISPSPATRTLTLTNVVPSTGAEVDLEKKFLDNEVVEMMLQEGGSGKKMVSQGFITNVSRSAGVGQTHTYTVTFKGTPAAFA